VGAIEQWEPGGAPAPQARDAFGLPAVSGKLLVRGGFSLVVDGLEIVAEPARLLPVPAILVGAAGGSLRGFVVPSSSATATATAVASEPHPGPDRDPTRRDRARALKLRNGGARAGGVLAERAGSEALRGAFSVVVPLLGLAEFSAFVSKVAVKA
jgi:hypothetical protein